MQLTWSLGCQHAPTVAATALGSAAATTSGTSAATEAPTLADSRWLTLPRLKSSRVAAIEPTATTPSALSRASVAAYAPSEARLPAAWEPDAAPRDWQWIVFHHTASERGDVETIDADHRRRTDAQDQPWLGIGYHFVIGNGRDMPDGLVEPTFRWREQKPGAHAGDRAHNDQGIGICLVGNFEQAPPSERQLTAAQELVDSLVARFKIDRERIIGHGDVKDTACPGRQFPLAKIARRPQVVTSDSTGAVPLLDLPAQLPAGAWR